MRHLLIALWLVLWPVASADAQISVNIGGPGINIGINMPAYPDLVLVPGYPVYYDPRANWNYFFYDGLYWVYAEDNWYVSSWYNGPWEFVNPEDVPLFVLRVPVRYYRQAPVYFRGWSADAPPRWGEHWGRNWEERRGGWDRWDRGSTPPAAPLPVYQRQYSGASYPRAAEQQHSIRSENYRYQPRDAVTQQYFAAPRDSGRANQAAVPAKGRVNPAALQTKARANKAAVPAKGQVTNAAVQNTGRVNKAAVPAKGQVTKAAVQNTGRVNPAALQTKGRVNKATVRNTGRVNKAAVPGKGQVTNATPQDKGRENKNAEHGQEPR